MIKRYGVIEIGTRGIRLLVADASALGIYRIEYSTGDLSNLGREADEAGNLSPSSITRVGRIVARYIDIAKEKGAGEILALATEVARTAPNRHMLHEKIGQIVPLEILNKEREAAYSFIACVDAFQKDIITDSTLLVVDQGGGSTELIYGDASSEGETVLRGLSAMPLGTVALSRIFVSSSTIEAGMANVREAIKRELLAGHQFDALWQSPPTMAIGLGSAITAYLKSIVAHQEGHEPSLKSLHGRTISMDEVTNYIERIGPVLTSLNRKPGDLKADSRLTTVIGGIIAFDEITSHYRVGELRVSRHGLRYGALAWRAGRQCRIELVTA